VSFSLIAYDEFIDDFLFVYIEFWV